jgi:hypothetical protein
MAETSKCKTHAMGKPSGVHRPSMAAYHAYVTPAHVPAGAFVLRE